MPLIDEIAVPFRLFLYGDNRTGKTQFLSTVVDVPEMNPALLVDADGGRSTLIKNEKKPLIFGFEALKVLNQLSDIVTVVSTHSVKTVMFDTITFFIDRAVNELAGRGKITWAHWQTTFREIQRFTWLVMERCPFVIFTAFPDFIKDDEGNLIKIEPLLSGKRFPRNLLSQFDTLCILTARYEKVLGEEPVMIPTLSSIPETVEVVGDRLGRCGSMDNPTMEKVYRKLKGGMN